MDRRGTGIAARGTEDGEVVSGAFDLAAVEKPEQLQGEILERERGPMKKFEQPHPLTERPHRRDHLVVEPAIGLASQPAPFLERRVRIKEREEFCGQFRVAQRFPAAETSADPRQRLGQEQPPVGSQARLDRAGKRMGRGLAACGNETHRPNDAHVAAIGKIGSALCRTDFRRFLRGEPIQIAHKVGVLAFEQLRQP